MTRWCSVVSRYTVAWKDCRNRHFLSPGRARLPRYCWDNEANNRPYLDALIYLFYFIFRGVQRATGPPNYLLERPSPLCVAILVGGSGWGGGGWGDQSPLASADHVSWSLRSFDRYYIIDIILLFDRAGAGTLEQISTMDSTGAPKDSPNVPVYFFDQVSPTVIRG